MAQPVPVGGEHGLPRENPLALLLSPLTYPQPLGANLGQITDERRARLKKQKHFLVRGTGWLDGTKIPVTELNKSGYRTSVFTDLPTRGLLWQQFCVDWGFVRGDDASLGKNNISRFLSKNHVDSYLDPRDQDSRYFTLYRAIGFIAFLDSFAAKWFADRKQGRVRRKLFEDFFQFAYYEGFVFDVMAVEPIIYKLGSLGGSYDVKLMGAHWRDDPSIDRAVLRPDPEFVSKFKAEVDLPWPQDRSIDAERVVRGIFVEERCTDLSFMLSVAAFTGRYFNAEAPPVRAGSELRGPFQGIVLERFVDIRTRPGGPWSPTIKPPVSQ